MSPEFERLCVRAVGLVPVSFEPPAASESCEGRKRITGATYGLCLTCARYGSAGIEPAVIQRQGVAECINYVDSATNAARAVSPDASVCAVAGVVSVDVHAATLHQGHGQGKPPGLGGRA